MKVLIENSIQIKVFPLNLQYHLLLHRLTNMDTVISEDFIKTTVVSSKICQLTPSFRKSVVPFRRFPETERRRIIIIRIMGVICDHYMSLLTEPTQYKNVYLLPCKTVLGGHSYPSTCPSEIPLIAFLVYKLCTTYFEYKFSP